MISRLKKIPSPNSLIIFEASARNLSFTRAAFELNLSQAAISKQIANLEQRLGYLLFIRQHRSLRLSQEGRLLYRAAASGLGEIADVVEALVGEGVAVKFPTPEAFASGVKTVEVLMPEDEETKVSVAHAMGKALSNIEWLSTEPAQ